ncbi:hypothetical protein ACQKQD_31545 [Methylobacterium sp. NPDC080182]|uniref:hypothetical protein n=1 Tax=Methylobacterium sp. NPDC080182 TaxID=3390590 RepID=UPI003D0844C1
MALKAMLANFYSLHNACMQQRIEAYRLQRRTLGYANQAGELRAVRAEVPDMAGWSFTVLKQVLRRVETTYTAFFRRGRGFPRFPAANCYHAAMSRIGDSLSFRGMDRRLCIVGIPGR